MTAVLLEEGGPPWREARRVLEENGGTALHVLPPSALIGEFPERAVEALIKPPALPSGEPAWSADGVRVVRGTREAETLLRAAEAGTTAGELSSQSLAALRFLAPPPPTNPRLDRALRFNADGTVDLLPPEVWTSPPLIPEDRLPGYRKPEGIGNGWYHTGEYLAGDVAVAICRPESNGSGDGFNTENWTAGELSYTLTELMKAMTQLQVDAPRGKLTFVYQTESYPLPSTGTVDCDYEAVRYSNFTGTVVLNVLGKLGYTSSTSWERMHEWVNAVRTAWGTDWAVGFFIVDNSAAATGRASAYVNGPTVWIFGSDSYKVYHHESGHSWGAWDEYASALTSPTALGGYTQDVNANSAYNDMTGYFSGAGEGINALMMSNVDYMSPWTRGQVGIWDLDGDGVYEPLDVRPGVTLNAPTGMSWGPLSFTGVAWGGSLKVESGAFASTDVTIGRIAKVEWRMNGGPWSDAYPADGAFNSSWEQYLFSSLPLRNWGYVFEVRATDNFGNVTTQYARRDYTATGSPLANQGAVPAASVSPPAGSAGTTFLFDATGSWDLEDGSAGLLYQWDFDGDLIWDTPPSPSPTATHTYTLPGNYTTNVFVVDRMGHGMSRPIQVPVAAADIKPTASFTVDSGLKFVAPAGFPVLFNFDATGVWDGEDSASSLQVRWDWQDDGVWDTAWSTTKTVVKDYAWDYAINPSQESGTTYLYSGTGINGLAQGFVAGTPSIGKAELFLAHNLGTGGSVTVGLRSSLSGAWITSVAVARSNVANGDWTLFDFPDATGLTVGNTYYLVILYSVNDMVMWLADNTNPYAGGQHHYTFNGGSSWSTNASYDHVFRIYDGALSTVPLTKSKDWRVRMEVKDSLGQTAQYVNHVCANGYDHPPGVTLVSDVYAGAPSSTFNLTATGSDIDYGTAWDGMVDYRWDADGDGTFDTEFAPGNTRAVSYPRSGIYQATCEARDRYHATARATVSLNVLPVAGGMGLADRTTPLTVTTDEREVDVNLAANGMPQEVILSENPSFTGASWRPYTPSLVHKLSAGAGLKTLYAKFRSGAGNESGSIWAQITYVPAWPQPMVTKSGNDARITWGPTGAFDYSVYRSNVADFSSYTEFTTSPTTSTTLDHASALTDGQLWFYRVETDPF